MIVLLNGPLGIGKSTLAEALAEAIDGCAWLDGDALVAVRPPPDDEVAFLHATLALLVSHYRRHGYAHVVIDHLWRTRGELDDLCRRLIELDPQADIRVFLLTLPVGDNLARIERRESARALDEREFARHTMVEERAMLFAPGAGDLGEPFDVSAPPSELVARLLRRIGMQYRAEEPVAPACAGLYIVTLTNVLPIPVNAHDPRIADRCITVTREHCKVGKAKVLAGRERNYVRTFGIEHVRFRVIAITDDIARAERAVLAALRPWRIRGRTGRPNEWLAGIAPEEAERLALSALTAAAIDFRLPDMRAAD